MVHGSSITNCEDGKTRETEDGIVENMELKHRATTTRRSLNHSKMGCPAEAISQMWGKGPTVHGDDQTAICPYLISLLALVYERYERYDTGSNPFGAVAANNCVVLALACWLSVYLAWLKSEISASCIVHSAFCIERQARTVGYRYPI